MSRIEWRRRDVLSLLARWAVLEAALAAGDYLLYRAAGPHPGFWASGGVGAGAFLFADCFRRGVRSVRRKVLGPPVVRASWPAGVSMPDAGPEILFLVEHGKKIQAIKQYREQNPGLGLKDAKDFVDGIVERGRLAGGVAGPDPAGTL
jgi:hypothetical protein